MKKRSASGYVTPRIHKNQREANLQNAFGIDLERYDGMLAAQDGKCAICGTEQEKLNRRLCVDHCHSTGRIRGLLCTACNVGLSRFRDSVEFLQNAIEYLQ